MTLFAVFAILQIVVVAAILLPPLWLGLKHPVVPADRKAANLAIFRDQLAELAQEKVEGTLTDADFEASQRELQRRLLEEVPADGQGTGGSRLPSRKTAIALALLLPAMALGGYSLLGNPKALDPTFAAPRPQMTVAQIEGMVTKLAERLKANPDDMQGWLMLARSYKAMGRYAEAANAYRKAEKVVMQDAGLLADYAEAIAMGSATGMNGKPRELVDQALKLDAENPQALLLAGVAAMQAGNRVEALRHWEKLLPMLEPDSEIEAKLKRSIDKLKQGE